MPRSLIVRAMVPAAAILSLVAQPAWARGPECWNSDEVPAAQLHAFHTTLMVGAMKCRSDKPDAMASYNTFAESRKTSIEAARTVVQARFIRELGPEMGATEFKNFDTEIANRVSLGGQDGLSCEAIDIYSRFATSASEADLDTLARLHTGVGINRCEAEPTLAALSGPEADTARAKVWVHKGSVPVKTEPSSEAPQAATVTVTTAAPEQPASETPPEAQSASPMPTTGSKSTPQVAKAEETAAPAETANVDPAKALEDAARALAAAATSLRTASAGRGDASSNP